MTKRVARSLLSALLLTALPGAARSADITIALSAAPSSADPHFHDVNPNNALARHIFDALLGTDASLNLQPLLATAWSRPDPLTLRFALRTGVTFHDGTPFTANDVVYSLCRALGVNGTMGFGTVTRAIRSASVVDDHTLELRTEHPDPVLLWRLAQFAIISARSGGAGTVSFHPADQCGLTEAPPGAAFEAGPMANGTGRYRLERFARNDAIVLRANTAWFGPRPHWDRVTMRPVPAEGPRTAGLLAGDFDLIENPAAQDLPVLKSHGGLAWTITPSNRFLFLQPDIGRASSPGVTSPDGRNPLQDARVREAISLAIDRQAIVDRVMDGLAVPANQFLPPGQWGALPDPPAIRYDPARARALLAEAGYPNGFGLVLSATSDRYINDAKVAQAVGQYLTRVGIRVSVDTMTQTLFFPRRAKRSFSLSMGGWSASDPMSTLRVWVVTPDPAHGVGGSNYGGYSSPTFDAAFLPALQEMDDGRREQMYREATRIALDDHVLIPLHRETTIWAYKDRYTYAGRADQLTDADDLTERH
jgi:peptide/nickel transport system substrate-binding protein